MSFLDADHAIMSRSGRAIDPLFLDADRGRIAELEAERDQARKDEAEELHRRILAEDELNALKDGISRRIEKEVAAATAELEAALSKSIALFDELTAIAREHEANAKMYGTENGDLKDKLDAMTDQRDAWADVHRLDVAERAELEAKLERERAKRHEAFCAATSDAEKQRAEKAEAERDGITRQYEAEIQKRLQAEAEVERWKELAATTHRWLGAKTEGLEKAEAEVIRVRVEWDKQQEVCEGCLKSSRLDCEKAEAELAELKGRRCETCRHWKPRKSIPGTFDCEIEACGEPVISPDFACSHWAAK